MTHEGFRTFFAFNKLYDMKSIFFLFIFTFDLIEYMVKLRFKVYETLLDLYYLDLFIL